MRNVMVSLMFVCGLLSNPAWAPCQNLPVEDHPLYQRSIKINPKLTPEYRVDLIHTIYRVAARHGISSKKLFAILAQECRFRLNCVNRISKDYGIGQINIRTIQAFGFDQEKLLNDLEYSVEAAAIVLSDFKKRHGKNEPNFWSRYNSGTPSKRQAYEIKVARFL